MTMPMRLLTGGPDVFATWKQSWLWFACTLAGLALMTSNAATSAEDVASEPAWVTEATGFEALIKNAVITGGSKHRTVNLRVDVNGATQDAEVTSATDKTLAISAGGSELSLPWEAWRNNDVRIFYRLGRAYLADQARVHAQLARYCLGRGFLVESQEEFNRAFALAPELGQDPEVKTAWEALKSTRTPAPAKSGTASERDAKDKESNQKVLSVKVSAGSGTVLKKLGKDHFLFGATSGPGDPWITNVRNESRANFEMRYQYICGGANTPSNWKTWNQPEGAYMSLYLNEAEAMGVIPFLTYYQMVQCLPARDAGGGEADRNKANMLNVDTMRAYFQDFIVAMKRCAEFKKPVVFHIEPDLVDG